MDDASAAALRDALSGDARAIEQLDTVPHERLRDVAESQAPLVLARRAVRRVLSDLRDGSISSQQAQRWASLM